MTIDKTKMKILKAGVKAWLKDADSVTASNIGRMCGMTHANVLYHFPYGVKDAVAEYAFKQKIVPIVAQLITIGSPVVKELSTLERLDYLKAFADHKKSC